MMVCYKKDLYVLKVIIAVWYIVNYDVCYKVDYYGLQYRSVCVTWYAIESYLGNHYVLHYKHV